VDGLTDRRHRHITTEPLHNNGVFRPRKMPHIEMCWSGARRPPAISTSAGRAVSQSCSESAHCDTNTRRRVMVSISQPRTSFTLTYMTAGVSLLTLRYPQEANGGVYRLAVLGRRASWKARKCLRHVSEGRKPLSLARPDPSKHTPAAGLSAQPQL
jgi:hypothetical protein